MDTCQTVSAALRPLGTVSYPTETISTFCSMPPWWHCSAWVSTWPAAPTSCLTFFFALLLPLALDIIFPWSLASPDTLWDFWASLASVFRWRLRMRRIGVPVSAGSDAAAPDKMRICCSITIMIVSSATSNIPNPRPWVTLSKALLLTGSLKHFLISSRWFLRR